MTIELDSCSPIVDSSTYEIEAEDYTFGMTKTCLIIVIIWKTHHIIVMSIKKSLENSRMKLVASRSLNSLVLSLRCILTSKIMRKVGGQPRESKRTSLRITSSMKTKKAL